VSTSAQHRPRTLLFVSRERAAGSKTQKQTTRASATSPSRPARASPNPNSTIIGPTITARSTVMTALAASLQAYFTDRLIVQRSASPNTIAAYRDTFRLLLRFATGRAGTPPNELDIAQFDAPLIAAFLDHLEHQRRNTVATRNNRLAAIHSMFAYLALDYPEHAATIQRVLAIPPKRTERNLLAYLTDPEVDALLSATKPPGPADATTPCSRSRSRPGYGSPS
jgi:integrase